MTSKAQKLLDQMPQTYSGWGNSDFIKLYSGFGFIIKHGAKHNVAKHPDFPQLRATLPRHHELAPAYSRAALRIIDQLNELRGSQEDDP